VPVWLDCDPGHDDAFAIMLAGHNPKLRLLGISTIMGNQTVEKTTDNALRVIELAGLRHIDVVKGQSKPILAPLATCPEIHGSSGMDTIHGSFPKIDTKHTLPDKAILHIYRVLSQSPEPVTLIATGALTNFALLIVLFPEIMPKISRIILIGGAIGIGNIEPVSEWNILIDPHAAKIIFESGLTIVQIPLEVTHTVLVTQDILKEIRSLNTPFSGLLVDLLLFFAKTYKDVFNFNDPPLHDPIAVAFAIEPEIFETVYVRVDIETKSELSSGQTVCDLYHRTGKPKNVHLALKVNVPRFWQIMLDALRISDSISPLNNKHKL